MKLSLRLQAIFLGLLLFSAAAMFAATDAHKGSLSITAPVQVAGQQLAAGEYTIKWDGAGPDVQMNIIRNGKVVATVPARLVKLERKPPQDNADIKTNGSGARTLTVIRFEGKTDALEVGAGSGGGDSASQQ